MFLRFFRVHHVSPVSPVRPSVSIELAFRMDEQWMKIWMNSLGSYFVKCDITVWEHKYFWILELVFFVWFILQQKDMISLCCLQPYPIEYRHTKKDLLICRKLLGKLSFCFDNLSINTKDLARPQHRIIMLFITNSLIGNVPNV